MCRNPGTGFWRKYSDKTSQLDIFLVSWLASDKILDEHFARLLIDISSCIPNIPFYKPHSS